METLLCYGILELGWYWGTTCLVCIRKSVDVFSLFFLQVFVFGCYFGVTDLVMETGRGDSLGNDFLLLQ